MQPELLERAKTGLTKRRYNPELDGGGEGGAVLPYMSYIDMCRCEGCGFQAVYMSRILLYDLGMIDMFGHTKKFTNLSANRITKTKIW